jgi:Predicted membrane protein
MASAMELHLVAVPSIAALALFALKRGFLTVRGAVSAIAVGSIVAVAHVGLFLILVAFFLSSFLLTRLRAEWKRAMGLKDVSGRSLRQVAGVGTPIAVFGLLYAAAGDPRFLGAAAVAVAAANADTWASEVGVAYGGRPRHILGAVENARARGLRRRHPGGRRGVFHGCTVYSAPRPATRRRWPSVESRCPWLLGRGSRQRFGRGASGQVHMQRQGV